MLAAKLRGRLAQKHKRLMNREFSALLQFVGASFVRFSETWQPLTAIGAERPRNALPAAFFPYDLRSAPSLRNDALVHAFEVL